MQARSQQYAQAIYTLINPLKDDTVLPAKERKRYGALCHRFPLIVRENGLVAAFGFLAAKGGADEKSPENLLLRHYACALNFPSHDALHRTVREAPLMQYCHLTQQTLQLAEWFKRYAEGVLKVSADGTSPAEQEEETAHA